jgi:tryptophanyl-tRNA synthetase
MVGVTFVMDLSGESDPEVARKKIMSATTDDKANVCYDKANQPGISNLLEILTLVRQANGQEVSLQQICDEYSGMERYGDFKKIVADEVAQFLANFQSRLANIDDAQIVVKLESSEHAMNEVANATLLRVQRAVGLRHGA